MATFKGFSIMRYDILRTIHAQTFKDFTYQFDKDKWKVPEFWEGEQILRPAIEEGKGFTGDCEDFAMVCLQKAMKAGFKARLVFCKVETGEGHCICEVASEDNKEAFYFDNRFRHLAEISHLKGYEFYSVSPWNPQPGEKRPWELVAPQSRKA